MKGIQTVGEILDELDANPKLGDNQPPPTPLEAHTADIDDLYDEAKTWLTGAAITTQEQADGVTELMDKADKAGKAADAQRVVEKKPHDDAAALVQKAYKPLIDKAAKIKTGTKAALTVWMIAERDRLQKIADDERRAADAIAEAARVAHLAAASSGDLEAMEEAEELVTAAKIADRDANRADKARPMAKVEGMSRGLGLRTVWQATEITDRLELMRFLWRRNAVDFDELMLSLANDAVKAGAREIPGAIVKEITKI